MDNNSLYSGNINWCIYKVGDLMCKQGAGQSAKWTLNKKDFAKWGRNILLFASPSIVVLLTTIQTGGDLTLAKGAFIQAILAAFIDLFKKLQAE